MMRTRRNSRAARSLAVAWAFAGALAIALAQPSEAAAQSECAEYISGGPNNPLSGHLIGSSRVTLTIGGNIGVDGKVLGAGVNGSITQSFNLGVYQVGRYETLELRCDNYTVWDIQ